MMLPVWIAGVAVLAGLAALGIGSGVRLLIVAGCAVIFLASLLLSAMKCRQRKAADRPEAVGGWNGCCDSLILAGAVFTSIRFLPTPHGPSWIPFHSCTLVALPS